MAGGFTITDGAIQDQIDASVADKINRARSRLPRAKALSNVIVVVPSIPEARRKAISGYDCV